MTGQTGTISLWFGTIFPPPFSQSDFDFRYLLGSYNLLRSLNMYVGPSVGLCVCQLAFQSVILITSKDSRPWLWPHCYTIRTWASGLKSSVLVRGSRAAPAALNGLKFFRTQGGFSLFWTNGFWWCKCFGDLGFWVETWALDLEYGNEIWARRLEFGPWGWDLGLKAGDWALRLEFGSRG